MSRSITRRIAVAGLIAALAVVAPGAAVAESPKADKNDEPAEPAPVNPFLAAAKAPGSKTDAAPQSFTNEDLARMFRGEAVPGTEEAGEADPATPAGAGEQTAQPAAPGETPSPPADPLAWMEERKARKAESAKAIEQAQQRVSAAEQRIAELEKRLLATRNPFLARPDIPEEERQAWDAEKGQQRVQDTEAKLREARDELATAQAELDRARRTRR